LLLLGEGGEKVFFVGKRILKILLRREKKAARGESVEGRQCVSGKNALGGKKRASPFARP